MKCMKCGREIDNGVVFCPYCGEKTAGKEVSAGESGPIYTAEVKGLMKSGHLAVYRDRTELITSSVQKAVYDYSALVAVKKGAGPDPVHNGRRADGVLRCEQEKYS